MIATLTYNSSTTPVSREFAIFSANFLDVEFERVTHRLLNRGTKLDSIGYRNTMEVNFKPLGADKQATFFLYAFSIASSRTVTYKLDGVDVTRNVTLLGDSLKFEFYDGVSFSNGFKMVFVEQTMTAYTTSDLLLIPTYTPQAPVIAGNQLTIYVNLLDDYTAMIEKENQKFIGGDRDDLAFGYRHGFTIDFGVVVSSAARNFLRDFCQSQSAQIDTRSIDPYNGRTFDVYCSQGSLKYKFHNSVHTAPLIEIAFEQITPFTTSEVWNDPAVVGGGLIEGEFIEGDRTAP